MENVEENEKIRNCAGKEAFQRINYLYQAANELTAQKSTYRASCLYTNLMVNISKKTVQRMNIDMKRSICKFCRCILIAGITGRVRIKKKQVLWTCLKCSTQKKFETKNKDYLPWTLQEESIVETLDYSKNVKTTQTTS